MQPATVLNIKERNMIVSRNNLSENGKIQFMNSMAISVAVT